MHSTRAPDVQLLFWAGCPSHEKALAQLRQLMADISLDPDTVAVHEVRTDADARRAAFIGSPTIRIDGVDVYPPADEPPALTCRVYRRRDGRYSPLPDPQDLREALVRAAQAERTSDP